MGTCNSIANISNIFHFTSVLSQETAFLPSFLIIWYTYTLVPHFNGTLTKYDINRPKVWRNHKKALPLQAETRMNTRFRENLFNLFKTKRDDKR
jgi:hypothetical protein